MKTTEQLITEGAEYFNKCGKHLFEINHPSGKNEYKHVCLITKNGEDYRAKILFRADGSEATVDLVKMTSFPKHKAEHSQEYFPEYEKIKAVRQNKYLRKIVEEIKGNILKDKKEMGPYNNRLYVKFSPIVEKSGI